MQNWTCLTWISAEDIKAYQTAHQPKPHKAIGVRRKYNDNTIPPLDFR